MSLGSNMNIVYIHGINLATLIEDFTYIYVYIIIVVLKSSLSENRFRDVHCYKQFTQICN